MMTASNFSRIQGALDYHFTDLVLLKTALTHRSFGTPNNERLEFLGDGFLNLIIAELLYTHFQETAEGHLSRWRASLVCQDKLAAVARSLSLGEVLFLGDGEVKSGGRERPSILADALEALLGAVYLDGGFDAVKAVVVSLFQSSVDTIETTSAKDAKTQLQEWLQARRLSRPRYELLGTRGLPHEQSFEVLCQIDELTLTCCGHSNSRRGAEQAAAALALIALKEQHPNA